MVKSLGNGFADFLLGVLFFFFFVTQLCVSLNVSHFYSKCVNDFFLLLLAAMNLR